MADPFDNGFCPIQLDHAGFEAMATPYRAAVTRSGLPPSVASTTIIDEKAHVSGSLRLSIREENFTGAPQIA